MARSSNVFTFQLAIFAIALAVTHSVTNRSFAEPMGGGPQMGPMQGDGHDGPVYRRKGFNNGPGVGGPGNRNWQRGSDGYYPQQFSGAYFQRPYPYHLDYYKMRYGGSYAPYYGNLYGPSNSFYPPQYNGDYGPGNPDPNKAEQNGPPSEYPPTASAGGHWAWCWVPDGSDNANTVYVAPSTGPAPSAAPDKSSSAAPNNNPATGTPPPTLSLP